MFSKLPRVSNLIPQSARDVMSLEVAERSLLYDKKASSLESLGQHFSTSSYEVATLSTETTIDGDGEFSSHQLDQLPSPGAPSGDHRRHVSRGARTKATKNARNNKRNLIIHGETSTTTTDSGTHQPTLLTPSSARRVKHHSAPSSAENTQRKAGSADSAKPIDRKATGNGKNRVGSPRGKKQLAKNREIQISNNRKSTKAENLNLENEVKALSSHELLTARRSAKDSQRQMKQKAKLAIAMWKERLTKKRESSLPRVATCNGCFPPLNTEDITTRDKSTERKTSDEPETSPKCRKTPKQQQIRPNSCRSRKMADDIISPILSPEIPEDEIRVEIVESPIPRSSPDDLSATEAASSSQHSTQRLDNKRNSASSRENNQRSKIPRPVDGQGDKIKKNDSAETTAMLSSQENLISPEDAPGMAVLPLLGPRDNAQQPLLQSQQVRPIVEALQRDNKRRRREDQRILHSTDDEEDDWPISPSVVGSQPIIPSRAKPRARHHARCSPKPVASVSPLSLQAGKRSSGGDADTADGEMLERGSPLGFVGGAGLDALSLAVIMPQRKPYLHRKMVGVKLGGMSNEMIKKRQRQEIYALNQLMTALEFAQFEHFCRTRNFVVGL